MRCDDYDGTKGGCKEKQRGNAVPFTHRADKIALENRVCHVDVSAKVRISFVERHNAKIRRRARRKANEADCA